MSENTLLIVLIVGTIAVWSSIYILEKERKLNKNIN